MLLNVFKIKLKMKLQKRFLLILIVIFSVSFFSASMQAQGIYSKNKSSSEEDATPSSSTVLRGKGDSTGGRGDKYGDPGPKEGGSPIGEAWLLLTALGGGYALLQKRSRKKQA
jgi:hypothetical protein